MKQSTMQRKITVWAAAATLGLTTIGVSLSMAADKDSEIATVMKKAYKGSKNPPVASLTKKAIDGKATKDELASLLEYNKTLVKQTPPKGEQKDWDDRTAALVKATEALASGDATASAALKTAADCKACHKLHQAD